MVRRKVSRWVLIYLTLSIFVTSAIPARSLAYTIPTIAGLEEGAYNRQKDMAIIQKELESKIISQRLKDLGLTPQEIKERLSRLSDAEIHAIASQIEALKAGGDGTGLLVAMLLILVIVLLILQITGRRIVIQ